MEKELYTVYSGLAIDVSMVKKHLEKNGVRCYAENHKDSGTESEWSVPGFDPCLYLKVEKDMVEKAVGLIEKYMKE
ncbi:MAG: hypothetical protein MJZ66_00875 [Bacteroidales bacterium]|nr:hypothetical protein [Bacteroidales bacterium]